MAENSPSSKLVVVDVRATIFSSAGLGTADTTTFPLLLPFRVVPLRRDAVISLKVGPALKCMACDTAVAFSVPFRNRIDFAPVIPFPARIFKVDLIRDLPLPTADCRDVTGSASVEQSVG